MRSIKFLFFVFLLISGTAFAKDRGTWFCAGCTNSADLKMKKGDTVGAGSDLITFIKSEVNQTLNAVTERWVPLDVITICDGVSCIPVVYMGVGTWQILGPAFPDPKRPYKNSSSNISFSSSGIASPTSSYTVAITGHWEWVDVYSDGNYVGYYGEMFIIDSMFVNFVNGSGRGRAGQMLL